MDRDLQAIIDNGVGNSMSVNETTQKQAHKEIIRSHRQDRRLRAVFGDRIYNFVCMYMFAVFFLVLLSSMPNCFHLSDAVLMTILGTTTANVLGILVIVATYYFHKKAS